MNNNNYYHIKNNDGIYIDTGVTVTDLGMDSFSRSYTDYLCCAKASANSMTKDMSAVANSAEKSRGALDALTTSVANLAIKSNVDTVTDSIVEIKDKLFTLEKKLESFEKHENLRNKIDNTIYRSICNEWERRSVY